ncbi:thiamine transporter [Caloramator quimbayensis]|uniref:Thiamine transporter n=1 Tax=Caloramator quimbayensis TaxID=1147123 RepID=A0A1T4XV89_9CLOT|nr:energy-coupled thiamine transporter ThiT [Caloramator quimbayensis]SKA93450.1 thiamine transporter [Caloramator quimbayensis]
MSSITNIFSDFSKVKIQSWAFIIALIAASFLIRKALKKENFSTKKLTHASLCIAASFILSYIRFYHWPQGGSITPGSMLPLMLFAYMYGPAEGILAGMVYGILQLIQDPFIVHYVQVLLDYPLAFGALGLAGYFKKSFSLGVIAGGFGRMFFHFLSGVFFFASYAPQGMSPILYSVIVNGTIVGTEVGICFVISLIPQFKNAILKIRSQVS